VLQVDAGAMKRRLAAHLHWYNHARTHHVLGGLLVPANRYYGRVEEVRVRIESGQLGPSGRHSLAASSSCSSAASRGRAWSTRRRRADSATTRRSQNDRVFALAGSHGSGKESLALRMHKRLSP